MKKPPLELWVIYDPFDGIHVFKTKERAVKQYMKWQKEADNDPYDSVWDMSEPTLYILYKKT